jgi:hypothetical protein
MSEMWDVLCHIGRAAPGAAVRSSTIAQYSMCGTCAYIVSR